MADWQGCTRVLISKEIIRPGDYCYLDKDGKPQTLVASRDFINHLKRQGNAMLKAGLSVPVPFEHQPDAVPMSKAEQAAKRLKDNAGWVTRYVMQPGNRLFALLDIPDPEVAKKLPTTIKWTSPHITSFVDGSGKTWDGVISHVALTSRPRITNQAPFPSVAAAMSAFAAATPVQAKASLSTLDVDLSLSGLLKRKRGKWSPAVKAAFSTWVNLAEEEVVEKKKKEGDGEGETETEKTETSSDAPPKKTEGGGEEIEMPGIPTEESVINDAGEVNVYDLLSDLLPAIGIDMPEQCNGDNFLECLYKAVLAKMKEKAMAVDNQNGMQQVTDPNNPNGAQNNPVIQEQQPLYMSLEAINKITDPVVRATAQRAAAVERRALTQYAQQRQGRIDNLTKKLPSQKCKDMLMSLCKDVRLSMTAEGEIVDPTEPTLAMLEEMAKTDVPGALTSQLSLAGGGASFGRHVTEQPQPHMGDEPMSTQRSASVLDEFCRNTGLGAPKQSSGQDAAVTALVDKLLKTA